jgi:hypothetical protein
MRAGKHTTLYLLELLEVVYVCYLYTYLFINLVIHPFKSCLYDTQRIHNMHTDFICGLFKERLSISGLYIIEW